MNRIYSVLLIVIFLCLPANVLADFKKTKIAVLDFQLQGEPFENQDMGTIVAEWFITAMVREGRFDVVERRMLQKIITEQKLAMSGVVDANSATRLGKLLGVKVIITGSVMKLQDITEINARIIDVESASIVTAENVRSHGSADLQELVTQMSRKIMKSFPLEGYVVNRKGDNVTLDLGRLTGVRAGMQFLVYKEGQVIKHPKTGEVLDVERIHTGTITITNVRQKICKAKIDEEESPNSIDYGQMVKSLIDTSPKESRLYVETEPAGARIRILNIAPPYEKGIILEPGPYHVEVSSAGFSTIRKWVNLGVNEEKNVSIRLQPTTEHGGAVSPPSGAPTPRAVSTAAPAKQKYLSSEQKKYIHQLQKPSDSQKRDAAKRIVRANITDTVILDEVEKQLLAGYPFNGNQKRHIDAMAWLCKALGQSGISKYRNTLRLVSENAPHRKLKKYALKSMRKL